MSTERDRLDISRNLNLKRKVLELFLEEANRGGRCGGSLQKKRMEKIATQLTDEGYRVTATQMKNQWNFMKGQYAIWSKLLLRSGDAYNEDTNTFSHSHQEWEEILQIIPSARQFRKKPLDFPDLMKPLFDGVYASGKASRVSQRDGLRAESLRPRYSQSPYYNLTPQGQSFHLDAISNSGTMSGHTTPSGLPSENESSSSKKRKKRNGFEGSRIELDDMIEPIRCDSAFTGPTAEQCMFVLNAMTTISDTDPLYFVACNLFCEKKEYREVWMNMSNEARLIWLRLHARNTGYLP